MEASWRKNYLRYKSFFLNMLSQYRERSDWKAYLEILLSLATISIFSIFALKPTVITIAQLIKQIDEKKVTLQKMDNKIQNLSKAQILYDKERGNINLLEQTAIPKSANADIFSRQIEGLSAKHQAQVTFFSLSEAPILGATESNTVSNTEDSTNKFPVIDFSITASAGIDQYGNLLNLLSDFNRLRHPPIINNVEFRAEIERNQSIKSVILMISGDLPYLP